MTTNIDCGGLLGKSDRKFFPKKTPPHVEAGLVKGVSGVRVITATGREPAAEPRWPGQASQHQPEPESDSS